MHDPISPPPPDPRHGAPAPFRIHGRSGPLVAVALHSGHYVRPEVEAALALSPSERLREEDPFTDGWTSIGDWRIVALRSRFEVDLNRPRDQAVYRGPEDAWGLHVWKDAPSRSLVDRSLELHDAFYAGLEGLFERLEREHGTFLVLDLHAYNHRREGPSAPPADPQANPEINIGTGTMDRHRWEHERTLFMNTLRAPRSDGRRFDVRENVRFFGGHLAGWVHSRFPRTGCVLAVEVKKFFMDEWTGRLHPAEFRSVESALRAAAMACREAMQAA